MHRNLPPQDPFQTAELNLPPASPDPEAEVALRGIAAWRHRRAESIVAKMDHKDELYEDLGNKALRRSVIAEKEKTTPERLMGVRLDRRMRKQMIAENRLYGTGKAYGPDTSRPVPSIRKSAIDSTAGRIPGSAMDGPEISFPGAVGENTKRIFVGASIPGYSSFKRKIERTINRTEFLFGRKTAYEATARKLEILAEEPKFGDKEYRRTRRQDRRRAESLALASEQPILSPWRTQRRARAEKRAERIKQAQQRKLQRRHEREQRRHARQAQLQAEHDETENDPDNNS